MKRFTALLLLFILLFCNTIPAFAWEVGDTVPLGPFSLTPSSRTGNKDTSKESLDELIETTSDVNLESSNTIYLGERKEDTYIKVVDSSDVRLISDGLDTGVAEWEQDVRITIDEFRQRMDYLREQGITPKARQTVDDGFSSVKEGWQRALDAIKESNPFFQCAMPDEAISQLMQEIVNTQPADQLHLDDTYAEVSNNTNPENKKATNLGAIITHFFDGYLEKTIHWNQMTNGALSSNVDNDKRWGLVRSDEIDTSSPVIQSVGNGSRTKELEQFLMDKNGYTRLHAHQEARALIGTGGPDHGVGALHTDGSVGYFSDADLFDEDAREHFLNGDYDYWDRTLSYDFSSESQNGKTMAKLVDILSTLRQGPPPPKTMAEIIAETSEAAALTIRMASKEKKVMDTFKADCAPVCELLGDYDMSTAAQYANLFLDFEKARYDSVGFLDTVLDGSENEAINEVLQGFNSQAEYDAFMGRMHSIVDDVKSYNEDSRESIRKVHEMCNVQEEPDKTLWERLFGRDTERLDSVNWFYDEYMGETEYFYPGQLIDCMDVWYEIYRETIPKGSNLLAGGRIPTDEDIDRYFETHHVGIDKESFKQSVNCFVPNPKYYEVDDPDYFARAVLAHKEFSTLYGVTYDYVVGDSTYVNNNNIFYVYDIAAGQYIPVGNDSLTAFCAASNGYTVIGPESCYDGDYGEEFRFYKTSDVKAGLAKALTDYGVPADMIESIVLPTGKGGNTTDGLTYGKESYVIVNLGTQPTPETLNKELAKSILGDSFVSLRALYDLLTHPEKLNLPDDEISQWMQLLDDLWPTWKEDVLEKMGEEFPEILELDRTNTSDDESTSNPDESTSEVEPYAGFVGSFADFIRWLIEHGYLDESKVGDPSDQDSTTSLTEQDITRLIQTYWSEFEQDYSGDKYVTLERYVRLVERDITIGETNEVINLSGALEWYLAGPGGIIWNGANNGESASAPCPAPGSYSWSVRERIRSVYTVTASFDYVEEWVIPGTDYVIYSKVIEGAPYRADGVKSGMTRVSPVFEHTVAAGGYTVDEPQTAGLSDSDADNIGEGATVITNQRFVWTNGWYEGDWKTNGFGSREMTENQDGLFRIE